MPAAEPAARAEVIGFEDVYWITQRFAFIEHQVGHA